MKKDAELSYEREDDVLMWKLNNSNGPIDYAEQVDNMIVHFDAENQPVLIEVLEASQFASEINKLLAKA